MAAFIKPTSLNRGEGLAAGSTGNIGGSGREGEGEEVVERSPKSTMVTVDFNSNSAVTLEECIGSQGLFTRLKI